MTLQVASIPDRGQVVSETWFGNDQVAEVSNESFDSFVIKLYAPPGEKAWSFELEDFQSILSSARDNFKRG